MFVTVLVEPSVTPDTNDDVIALVDVMLLLPTVTEAGVLMIVNTTELDGDDTVGVAAEGSKPDN